jgi:hybrid cluster-associated redox disulfide protein
MIASFSKDWSVKQTLEHYPETISIFLRLKTNCIGCWLERFCTLEEVSGYYGIPIETLLDAMQSSVLIDYADE